MTELVITSGAVLVGSGAWFADKIFGPTAEALGENLKAYLGDRLARIFHHAAETAEVIGADLKPIAPGLLNRMIIDAAMSASSDDLEEWWANLFLEASITGDNVVATFSDMMAVIGPKEARLLQEVVKRLSPEKSILDSDYSGLVYDPRGLEHVVIQSWRKGFPFPDKNKIKIDELVGSLQFEAPSQAVAWRIPYTGKDEKKITYKLTIEDWYKRDSISFEILERSRILKKSRFFIPSIDFQGDAWVDYIGLTELGVAFMRACTGREVKDDTR